MAGAPETTILMTAGGAGGGSLVSTLIMFGLIFVVFYFLLIRPQQKRLRDHREMVASLRRGDSVVTTGGVIGKITRVTDDELVLEVAEGVRIKVLRGAVSDVRAKTEPAPANDNVDDEPASN